MTGPRERADDEDDTLLVHAYVDGELDVLAARAFEKRLDFDPALRRAVAGVRGLREAMRAQIVEERASPDFRARMAALAAPSVTPPQGASRPEVWRRLTPLALAASLVVAAGLGSVTTWSLMRGADQGAAIATIVASHQRGLLAANPVDVASTDRHTVKPWFDSKLAVSPPVLDLAAEGYALVGGRLDIVDGKPVPTMVYRAREHAISLIAVPAHADRATGGATLVDMREGYTVLGWQAPGFMLYAVSDVAPEDLRNFASRWRAAAASN